MSVTLYRPVGLKELQLIAESGFTKFPPRLPSQPFFYPVLSLEYAQKIARDWNTKDPSSGYIGAVTTFEIHDATAKLYKMHCVGGDSYWEYWIPDHELEFFNSNIISMISLIEVYVGDKYEHTNDIDDIILSCEHVTLISLPPVINQH